MYALFDDAGKFHAGRVMSEADSSLQVELDSGKRVKVKAANLMLRFDKPAPAELLARARALADEIDLDLAWEFAPEAEFAFADLAREYFDAKAGPEHQAAALLRLFDAPHYFRRLGRGQFKKAPEETVKAALLGIERKKQVAAQIEAWAAELAAGQCPEPVREQLYRILFKPDKNGPEYKAVVEATRLAQRSPLDLLAAAGAISSPYQFHWRRFLFEFFAKGTGFPALAAPPVEGDLPLADGVAAFSIDDSATTEIDDALSVRGLGSGTVVFGIHIAAPGLGFAPDSDLGRITRERLSTVYMPGRKITMLPEDIVEYFTLAAGHTVPAISLYLDVGADYRLLGHETRIERVPVVANLRHHDIEPVFNAAALAEGLAEFPWRDELKLLWEFAQVLEAGRGKPSDNSNRKDYNFIVDWTADSGIAAEPGKGFVGIEQRERGSPLDTLVAELMIMANATWGAMLRDAGIPALYRVQTAGKVRMSTVAAAHEGLGVDCYAWSSSPLRRYCDLLNQWQLIALLQNEPPPFPPKSADLLAAMRDFELTYAAYAEFQRGMERYWCLRWLQQQGATTVLAQVQREALARLDSIPLVARVPSLPELPRGAHVRLAIEGIDLLEAELRLRYVEQAPELAANSSPDAAFADDEGDEVAG